MGAVIDSDGLGRGCFFFKPSIVDLQYVSFKCMKVI